MLFLEYCHVLRTKKQQKNPPVDLVKNIFLKQIVKQPHCWDSPESKKTQLLVSLNCRGQALHTALVLWNSVNIHLQARGWCLHP